MKGFIAFLLLTATGALAADLRDFCPGAVAGLVTKAREGVPLTRPERLAIVLERLWAMHPSPKEGAQAYQRMVDVMRAVEKEFLPEWVVRAWGKGTRAELVDEAFRVYDFANPDSPYDETAYPPAFAEVLKPPARRYAWKSSSPDREIIPQLEHVTVFHRNGATEIQRIDPAVRVRLASPSDPLVVAIAGDAAYFDAMPRRDDLVIFRKRNRDGRGVW